MQMKIELSLEAPHVRDIKKQAEKSKADNNCYAKSTKSMVTQTSILKSYGVKSNNLNQGLTYSIHLSLDCLGRQVGTIK